MNASNNSPESNSDADLESFFDDLYKDFHLLETIEESRSERVKKRLTGNSFVYGEITFEGMKQILDSIQSNFGAETFNNLDSFVDLGSGVGKAVISSALLGNFKKSIGIELLENLHTISDSIRELYELKKRSSACEVVFLNKNLIDYDFSNNSLIFTNSTCWNLEMIKIISEKAERVTPNSFIVNTDQQLLLNSKNWLKLKPINVKMSWGFAKTFISRKL